MPDHQTEFEFESNTSYMVLEVCRNGSLKMHVGGEYGGTLSLAESMQVADAIRECRRKSSQRTAHKMTVTLFEFDALKEGTPIHLWLRNTTYRPQVWDVIEVRRRVGASVLEAMLSDPEECLRTLVTVVVNGRGATLEIIKE